MIRGGQGKALTKNMLRWVGQSKKHLIICNRLAGETRHPPQESKLLRFFRLTKLFHGIHLMWLSIFKWKFISKICRYFEKELSSEPWYLAKFQLTQHVLPGIFFLMITFRAYFLIHLSNLFLILKVFCLSNATSVKSSLNYCFVLLCKLFYW